LWKDDKKKLEDRKKKLEEENTDLQEENTNLQKNITELWEKNKELQEKNKELQEENTNLQKNITELQEKNTELQEKNTDLQEENKDLFIGIVILSSLVIILLLTCIYFRHQLKALERSHRRDVRPLKEEAETKSEETKETEVGPGQSVSSIEMLQQPFQVDMNKVEPDEVRIILNNATDQSDDEYDSCD